MTQNATRKAAITGIGAVTPLGGDLQATLAALRSGAMPLRSSDAGPAGYRCAEFDARRFFAIPKALKLTDHRTRMAVAAAAMARDDAALHDAPTLERAGVVIGTSGSDLQAPELARALQGVEPERAASDTAVFGERILAGLHPFWLLVNLPNMVSAHVSIQIGTRGPNSTVMTDWVAGAQAIGEAARWIESGECDVVFAGGSDAGVLPFVHASYAQAGLLPWDDTGTAGFIPADGAAMFVLEDESHARARGARVYGTIRGYGSSCATSPDDVSRAVARAVERALAESKLNDVTATGRAFPGGFALAADAPIRMAAALSGRVDSDPLLVDAAGYLGQAVALVVGRPTGEGH